MLFPLTAVVDGLEVRIVLVAGVFSVSGLVAEVAVRDVAEVFEIGA